MGRPRRPTQARPQGVRRSRRVAASIRLTASWRRRDANAGGYAEERAAQVQLRAPALPRGVTRRFNGVEEVGLRARGLKGCEQGRSRGETQRRGRDQCRSGQWWSREQAAPTAAQG